MDCHRDSYIYQGHISLFLPRLPKFPSSFEQHWLGNLSNLGSNKEIQCAYNLLYRFLFSVFELVFHNCSILLIAFHIWRVSLLPRALRSHFMCPGNCYVCRAGLLHKYQLIDCIVLMSQSKYCWDQQGKDNVLQSYGIDLQSFSQEKWICAFAQ